MHAVAVEEREYREEDSKLLFEVLFDIKALRATRPISGRW